MEILELKNKFGKVFFTLSHDKKNELIYANWIGFVSVEDVIEGATKCLEAFESTGYTSFINDNRQLTGPWNKANDWIAETWMPRALQSGLKNFAFIVSPNVFGEMSAVDLETRLDNVGFVMRNFKDYEEGLAWIQERVKSASSVPA